MIVTKKHQCDTPGTLCTIAKDARLFNSLSHSKARNRCEYVSEKLTAIVVDSEGNWLKIVTNYPNQNVAWIHWTWVDEILDGE